METPVQYIAVKFNWSNQSIHLLTFIGFIIDFFLFLWITPNNFIYYLIFFFISDDCLTLYFLNILHLLKLNFSGSLLADGPTLCPVKVFLAVKKIPAVCFCSDCVGVFNAVQLLLPPDPQESLQAWLIVKFYCHCCCFLASRRVAASPRRRKKSSDWL